MTPTLLQLAIYLLKRETTLKEWMAYLKFLGIIFAVLFLKAIDDDKKKKNPNRFRI